MILLGEMNYEDACRLFEFKDGVEITDEMVRKRYLKLCLKYHPDKNGGNEEGVLAQFQNIQEAYVVLLEDQIDDIGDDIEGDEFDGSDISGVVDLNTISHLIPKWLQSVMYMIGGEIQDSPIFQRIMTKIKERVILWAKGLDREVLWKIHETIKRVAIQNTRLQYVEVILREIIEEKTCNDRHICLEPMLEDLFTQKIIRHVEVDSSTGEEHVYVIPSWMEESVFDCPSGEGELVFTCTPKCPIGVKIDKYHNIHVGVSYHINELWGKEKVDVEVCPGQVVSVIVSNLLLRNLQTVIFSRRGIPRGDVKNVFDTSNISDVMVHVTLIEMW